MQPANKIMKKLLQIMLIVGLMTSLTSCRKSFVEKTLKDVGNGKYRAYELNGFVLWEHSLSFFAIFDKEKKKNPFSDIKIINSLLDCPEKKYWEERKEKTLYYFNTNVLFDKIVFISRIEGITNIYKRDNIPTLDYCIKQYGYEPTAIIFEALSQRHEEAKKRFGYKKYNDYYVYCEKKDVPTYIYKYKLDNKNIAYVEVVKIDKQWKIIMLLIE